MENIIPEKLKNLAQAFDKPLYIVGGACRDFLANLNSSFQRDWDICAPIPAEELEKVAVSLGFEVTAVYKNTGTARLAADGEEYEFTSFRTDKYIRGGHTPEEVYFTDDIVADARRRDFKCNAIYYDISGKCFVDPLGGMKDVMKKKLSTVAPAEKVFGEDGLRLMRLCRIAAETGFTPDEECLGGAMNNAGLIRDIARERVWQELYRILHADMKYGTVYGQYMGLKYLFDTRVGDRILPELAAGRGMSQRDEFHNYDVLEHSLRCVKYADKRVRLAALLHDVGKPRCMNISGRFTDHEGTGALMAGEICTRLRVPKRHASFTCRLIKYHMYDYDGQTRENKVRKFIVFHKDLLGDLLDLKQADYSACKDDLSPAPVVVKWKNIMQKMQDEGAPLVLSSLAVKGTDLIDAGISPNETGGTLQYLLGECAINAKLNKKKKLIPFALAYVRQLRGMKKD